MRTLFIRLWERGRKDPSCRALPLIFSFALALALALVLIFDA